MAEAAVEQQPQGPDLGQLIGSLNNQLAQLARNQEVQAQTLRQLAQGTQVAATAAQQAAQASRPVPDPDNYTKLNDQYLKTLATDPIGLRNAEKQQLAQEIAASLRQEFQAQLGATEQRRRAEEMEKSIYQQNPDLSAEGPNIEFYLKYLNATPSSTTWSIQDKIAQAVQWAREEKAAKEQVTIERWEAHKKNQARASMPGGSSFREPNVESEESAEDANAKRFELLQGRKATAMGGGRYMK
jgi:hypothetical protein